MNLVTYARRKAARSAENLRSLRQPSIYYIVDAARDLKPRTLAKVYQENRAGRGVSLTYTPNQGEAAKSAYLAWAKLKGHTPHPASLDPYHPINEWRERAPKPDRVADNDNAGRR
jgi:hypothetical protein